MEKIEHKIQKKGIEYVLTDELIGNIIDTYVEDHSSYEYNSGFKGLSWTAREQIMFQQCPLSLSAFHDLDYKCGTAYHAIRQIEDGNYRRKPGKLYGLDLNSWIDLRVSIHKAAISVANDQFLIEEIYFNHKDFLVKKLSGKEKYVNEILSIVQAYLTNERNPRHKSHYDILARREAAGGRDLIVTYQVLLEDLLTSL